MSMPSTAVSRSLCSLGGSWSCKLGVKKERKEAAWISGRGNDVTRRIAPPQSAEQSSLQQLSTCFPDQAIPTNQNRDLRELKVRATKTLVGSTNC